jgi:hypothetical protein
VVKELKDELIMEVREALTHIAEIRQRLAESELFRGYRALPVAASGLLALAAGWLQPLLVPDPVRNVRAFVLLWSAVAVLSLIGAGLAMGLRDCFVGPSHTRVLTWIALRQFVPCIFSGAVVAGVIVRYSPESAWLLPGLWQLFFAQGVFASCRILPRTVYLVAGFYLAAGSANLLFFRDGDALAPWTMGMPFGLGQLFAASILYWTLERQDAVETET